MLVLSIRQPWAYAIIYLDKDVENRTWYTKVRGPIYIHASQKFDYDGYEWIQNELGLELPAVQMFRTGGIIGRVNLVSCVKDFSSRWFFGPYGFILRNPVEEKFRECKGQLGFFEVAA